MRVPKPTRNRPLRIGISTCPNFKGKTLQYFEQSLVNWILSHQSQEALAYLIPSTQSEKARGLITEDLDGLVLPGGSDVSPSTCGEKEMLFETSAKIFG